MRVCVVVAIAITMTVTVSATSTITIHITITIIIVFGGSQVIAQGLYMGSFNKELLEQHVFVVIFDAAKGS